MTTNPTTGAPPTTATAEQPVPPSRSSDRQPVRATLGDARTTGLLYLVLTVLGMLGFLVVRPQVFTVSSPTLVGDLAAAESLARIGIVLELAIVTAMALLAWWFVRLFRRTDAVTAGALGAFGVVNAAIILGSAAALATAVELAVDPVAPTAQVAALVALSEQLWGAGSIFFGLWLVPMGLLVLRAAGMPRSLGRLLVVGGVGYIAGAFVGAITPGALIADLLAIPATAGEFWMIGYLLHGGAFRRVAAA